MPPEVEAKFTMNSEKTYKPSLILTPVALILPWKQDGLEYFSDELHLHYFIEAPSTAAPAAVLGRRTRECLIYLSS